VADVIPTSQILGIPVARLTVAEFIERAIVAARQRRHWRICYINAANLNLAGDDSRYAAVLRAANVIYADGQAVVWASRYLGCPLPERVNAGDFFDRFCEACVRDNLTVYFLGSRPGVAQRAAQKLAERIAGLRIVGAHDGFFDLSQSDAIVAEINRLAPDVLVVGMGAPRQEFWVAEHFERLNVGVAWCVGALLEYVAGKTLRAPVWMRKVGLEWVFRLVLEPRRLWRRYLVGNWVFLWRVWRAKRGVSG
jgi:N-acetylglucosaminyldiphosphoundecaprenol N-acetyl-beta-D-mannosaminyltransferase